MSSPSVSSTANRYVCCRQVCASPTAHPNENYPLCPNITVPVTSARSRLLRVQSLAQKDVHTTLNMLAAYMCFSLAFSAQMSG